MTNMLAELRLNIDKPDFILRPSIKEFAILNNAPTSELIKRGENVVRANIDNLSKVFSTSQNVARWLKPSRLPGQLFSEIIAKT